MTSKKCFYITFENYKPNHQKIIYENNKIKIKLSNVLWLVDLFGWIKKIKSDYVKFGDGEKIYLKNLDYKLIKPLIWW